MIDATIAGRIFGHCEERKGHSNTDFVTCTIKAMTDDGETLLCNVIAFKREVREKLLSMNDGESVCVSGALTPKVWVDKQGNYKSALDLVAHAILNLNKETK